MHCRVYIKISIMLFTNDQQSAISAIKRGRNVVITGPGGTGKTPMVEWICRQIREKDVRTAILSRGYGAEATGANDEATARFDEILATIPSVVSCSQM